MLAAESPESTHKLTFPVYVDKALRACFLLISLGPFAWLLDSYLLALPIPLATILLFLYLVPFTSHAEFHGGLERPFARDWAVVRWLTEYFKVRLVNLSNKPLDPSRRYIFCLHPHGMPLPNCISREKKFVVSCC
jgi:hypothetical protein